MYTLYFYSALSVCVCVCVVFLTPAGGHLDVIRLLVEHGADVDSQDNRKVSCLMAAFRRVSAPPTYYKTLSFCHSIVYCMCVCE